MILPYELRIGVTGHRNLPIEKVPAIEKAVGDLLASIAAVLCEGGARPFGPCGSPRSPKQQCQLW